MDTESGLKRIGGNVTLYKKLLTIFLNDIKLESLVTAIESGNFDEISTVAHTIKGVSANLSLINLQNISADIDAQAKAGNDCNSFIPELTETFNKTVELVNAYLNQ